MSATVLPDQQQQPGAVTVPAEWTAPDRPWRRAFLHGLMIWVVSRALVTAATAASWIGEAQPAVGASGLIERWTANFDAAWLLAIAENGYAVTKEMETAAFFPLYPLLVNILAPVFGGQYWLAALVISNAALLVALTVIYRLTEHEFGPASAGRAIFYLVAFPTGFYLTAAYNTSLFIALLAGALYAIRTGKWWVAGLLGALASATRSSGVLLTVPFAYEYFRHHRFRLRPSVLAGALIPLGLGGFMLFTWQVMGSPFAPVRAQSNYWGRELDWPWTPVLEAARYVVTSEPWRAPLSEVWIHNVLELATVLFMLAVIGFSVAGRWRVRRDQLVYPIFAAVLVLFMISFPTTFKDTNPYPLFSASRIGLEIVPAFMLLGMLSRRGWTDRLLLAVFLPVQGILIMRFMHFGWVA
jgi:Gpi18-like mannosyltransferase